jgi:hypothetical protein
VRAGQPPYSPGLQPSDFWLFGSPKSSLAGCKLNKPNKHLEVIATNLEKVPREKLDDISMERITRVKSVVETKGY